jgi:hypothetical protein
MTFTATLDATPLDGVLRYIDAEHSFSFDVGSPAELLDRSGPAGVTSLSIGTLQVEVGVATGQVCLSGGFTHGGVGRKCPSGVRTPSAAR